jgi:hypothetical protein
MNTILNIYPDVNREESDKLLIRGGRVAILKNLIRKKKHSMSIFDICIYAADVGNVDIVQYMVEQEKLTMELVSDMVVTAVYTGHLNVLQYMWTVPKLKETIAKAKDPNSAVGLNILMLTSFAYDFEMTQWILENIPIDIEEKNSSGTSVLKDVIDYNYSEHYTSFEGEQITPHHFYRMVALLVTVGKADAADVWHFLRKKWSKKVSKLKVGEDEMLKNFIRTLYLFKRPTQTVEDGLRATRYAYLVDEVENVRQKVSERKNSLSNLVGEHLLPDLANMVLDMDNLTTDEMWNL